MSSREHILKRFRETRDNTLSRLPFVKDEKDEKDEKEEEKEERSSHKLDQTISEPGPPPSLTPSASAFPHNISEPVSIDQSFPSRPSFSRRGTASSSSFVSEGEKGEGEEKKEEEKKKVEEEEEEEMTVDQEITEEAGRVKKSRQPTLLGVGIRVGVVVLMLFMCGFWGFSFLYVMVAASMVLCDGLRKEEYQNIKDDFTTQRRAHDINHLKMVLEEVPPWVNLTQKERVEWLNVVLETLWPYMKEATEQTLKSSLTTILEQYKPDFLSALYFERLNLGDTPPLIQYIDTVLKDDNKEELGDEQIQIDISLHLANDNDIVLAAEKKGASIHTALEDLEVRGTMRVILAPVSTSFPCFKALSFCFISKPTISFRLNAGKVPLMAIPGFADWLTDFLNESLAFYLVWPKKYTYELTELTDKERRISKDISAAGIAWLEIIGAKDLKNVEKIGVIDPYCVLTLGNTVIETPMVKNDTNPVWRFKTQLLIHDPENEIIQFEIFDKDDIKKDVKLESAELDLSDVFKTAGKPRHFDLKLKKQGTLQVRIVLNPFFRFSEIFPRLDDEGNLWENEFSNRVAFINVVGCKNLPSDDALVEVNYEQALAPSQKSHRTFAASQNFNPVFEQTFAFNLPRKAFGTKFVFNIRKFGKESKKGIISSVFYKLPETLEPFGPDGKEVTLSLPGSEGKLTLHILIKVVLSQEEKDRECAKMDAQRIEQEELQERMYDLRTSLGTKKLVALESVSAFTAAYLGGSLCSLSFPLGVTIAGIAFGMKYFYSFTRAVSRYELQQSTVEDLAISNFDRSVLDKDTIKSQSKALPEWVSDPTIEKNEWINELLIALWPCLRIAIRKSILSSLEPILVESKPEFLDAIIVHQIGMGSTAPLVTGIRAFPRKKVGQIAVLDLDMSWASDFFLTLHILWKGFKLPITVSDLSFKGVARVKLHDLVEVYPCFKNISISFREPPTLELSVSLGGIPIMSLPNANTMLKQVVISAIQDQLVWPHELMINILANSPENLSKMGRAQGAGILRLYIKRAKGVRNVDTFGKSDPYVIVYVKDSDTPQKVQTAVKDDTLDPEWHEYHEFVVQKRSFDIDFRLYDEDVGKDDLLGDCFFDTYKIPENIPVDVQMPVKFKAKDKGQYFFQVEYKPFVSSKDDTISQLEPDDYDQWSDSALTVFVTKCVGLSTAQPYFVSIEFGGKKQEAKTKKKSMNPSFDSNHNFPFILSEMMNEKITFRLKYRDGDIPVQSKEKEMGSFSVKLEDVIQQDINGEFPLSGGPGVNGSILVRLNYGKVLSGRVHAPISIEEAPTFYDEQEKAKEPKKGKKKHKQKEKKKENESEKEKEKEKEQKSQEKDQVKQQEEKPKEDNQQPEEDEGLLPQIVFDEEGGKEGGAGREEEVGVRESGSARDSWGGVRVRQSGRDWERDSGIDRKKFKKEKSWRGSLKLNKKDKQTVGGEEKTLAMTLGLSKKKEKK